MIVSLLVCFPLIMYLNYMGYVDIGGLNIIILLLLISKKGSFKIKENVIIGILLMLLFYFRRWYMFYSVSFFIVLFSYDIYEFLMAKDRSKILFGKYLKKYATIVFTIISILGLSIIFNILLFRNDPIFKLDWRNFYLYKLIFVDYSQKYVAYNRPLLSDIIALGVKFGYCIIILNVISLFIAIKNKKNIKPVVLLFIQMLLCFILFEKTQSHDIHHFLLYVVNIMLMVTYIFANSKYSATKVVVSITIVINIILSVPLFYNIGLIKELKELGIVNNLNLNILVRKDMEEFESINNKITKLSENETKKIYLNASSSIINDSMIYSYDKTNGKDYLSKSFLLGVSHVDSRDGVPESLKNADIIIVTDPDQIHMVPENQKIISYINKIFLDDSYKLTLSDKFNNIETMNIGDVKMYVFSKIEEITDDEYNEFMEKANEYIK